MAKFFNTVEVAGRSYKRWSVTGTFSTTDNVVEKYKDKFYVAPGDIVRWHSNNQIPFGDILLDFAEALLITPKQVRKSCELKEKETDEFWKKLGEKL
jgi:RecB family endonuclease NucS